MFTEHKAESDRRGSDSDDDDNDNGDEDDENIQEKYDLADCIKLSII